MIFLTILQPGNFRGKVFLCKLVSGTQIEMAIMINRNILEKYL